MKHSLTLTLPDGAKTRACFVRYFSSRFDYLTVTIKGRKMTFSTDFGEELGSVVNAFAEFHRVAEVIIAIDDDKEAFDAGNDDE